MKGADLSNLARRQYEQPERVPDEEDRESQGKRVWPQSRQGQPEGALGCTLPAPQRVMNSRGEQSRQQDESYLRDTSAHEEQGNG